jgi:hypothetical protein
MDEALRRYILGLALIAAIEPLDAFLRQGCLLVPDTAEPAQWKVVGRRGERKDIDLTEQVVLEYAQGTASAFGKGENRRVSFDKTLAKEDAKKADKSEGLLRSTMSQFLLLSVRFTMGAIMASEWPPAPARLFRWLVAGAAKGRRLSEGDRTALAWLGLFLRP